MSPLEIISRLCDVTETLSAIVKKQQTIIEQSKIEETVKAELRQEVEAVSYTHLDVYKRQGLQRGHRQGRGCVTESRAA